jgi:hypothetical protein
MPPSGRAPFQHVAAPNAPQIIATYCPLCQQFVAASPRPLLLEFVERMHVCLECMAFTARRQV